MNRTSDRFSNYREISAKFSSTGSCGHTIKTGDSIGYLPSKPPKTQYADCWRKWSIENAQADMYERMMGGY